MISVNDMTLQWLRAGCIHLDIASEAPVRYPGGETRDALTLPSSSVQNSLPSVLIRDLEGYLDV